MQFNIIKNTLPNMNRRAIKGVSQREIDRIVDKPREISVRIRGLKGEPLLKIIPQLQDFVLHELCSGSLFTSLDEVSVNSVEQTTGGRGFAVVLLSRGAWRQAFESKARVAWEKARKARADEVVRRRKLRKKIRENMLARKPQASLRKKDPYKNVLVEALYIGGKLRIRPVGKLNAVGKIDSSMNVSFPKHLRAHGAQYVVEYIEKRNNFYVAKGKITRVV